MRNFHFKLEIKIKNLNKNLLLGLFFSLLVVLILFRESSCLDSINMTLFCATCALGAALAGSGDGPGAGRRRAHQGDAGDAASDAGAAAAGV